ncbi:MAG: serine/threonine-protein kinase [Streptosporangiaceae bacterium]
MLRQASLVEPLRRWDPEQIGGYVLVGRLGAGAMGRVYLGRSAAGRLVAVKTIKIELADEPDFRTRFAQEVAAARRVSGAFTAAVVAAEPEADVPWLATAYVPAPALSDLVRACGPLPVAAVRWLAAGCAEALESIHAAGLVHRDLKPSNVLVSPDGPRVIDFGVARAAERIQLTVTRGAVGTPAYMAPEQARDTRQATMASDVYSLGATMLFAATGHAPYHGDTVMDVLVQLAMSPPDLGGLPPELAGIVHDCMQRDPRLRPSSASVLAELAPFIGAPDGGHDLGPSSLPGPALALIAEYRKDPRPAGDDSAAVAEDATFGSHPGYDESGGSSPRTVPPAQRRHRRGSARSRRARASTAGGRGPAATARPGAVTRMRSSWAALPGRIRAGTAIAALVVAASLLGAGVRIGASADGGRTIVRHPIVLGPVLPPPPPGQGPPGQGGKAQIGIAQPTGDSHTAFVVHGQGFVPGRAVTIAIVGVGASPEHPIADGQGTFNYAINQDHEFFSGGLPPGVYHILVTAAGGVRVTAAFAVNRQ